MCEFISWIEIFDYNVKGGKKFYYLTNDCLNTTEGAKLLNPSVINDINGHGAIMSYYKSLNGGLHRECEDFSKPRNFPAEIADAFKSGKMSMIGINTNAFTKEAKYKFIAYQDKCKDIQRRKLDDLSRINIDKIEALEKAHDKKIKLHKKRYPVTCSEDKKARAKYSRKQREILNHKLDIRENTNDRDIAAIKLETKIAIAKRFTNIIKVKKNRRRGWQ
jgi:hypothetical protein